MKETEVEYVGHDLESMDQAVNYHAWILDLFRPYLGRHIVEVGAGTGSFSRMLYGCEPERLDLVEPSAMFDKLSDSMGSEPNVRLFHGTFPTVAGDVIGEPKPDTFVYINVLEHIEDDVAELKLVHRSLSSGGRICIFVPAVPFLLSDFDRQIGHFRRYSRNELITKCEAAGFRINFVRGFDFPGILPWLVKYRILRSLTIGNGAVKLYDRALVPLIRPFENLLKPPIGKNLVLVAEA